MPQNKSQNVSIKAQEEQRRALERAVRRLEEITLNTAPAIHQYFYDGWVLRASGTETHRSNSATVLHESTLPLSDKINYCEAWYAACQQPIIFRINEAISPAGLDVLLAERGYATEAVTLVMTVDLAALASLADQPQELPLGVRLVERSIADSLSELHRMKGNARALAEQEIKRQELWRGPQIVLSLRSINGVLCSGMARIEEGHLGLFDIYTPENQRGNGYASILVSELLAWGVKEGAHTAFLQVVENNEPALAIYQRFAFKAQYRYWSRVKVKAKANASASAVASTSTNANVNNAG